MSKRGIKILDESPGDGPLLQKGDRVRLRYSIRLNRGECVVREDEALFTIGDRKVVAGFRYGLEGIRAGGTRRFEASPHLCCRDLEVDRIPQDAVLIFEILNVEVVASQ